MYRLVQMPAIIDHGGVGARSNFLRNIKSGLFPPGIKIGRSNVWPEYEITALQAARIRGDSEDQIRALVAELLERRKALPKLAGQEA